MKRRHSLETYDKAIEGLIFKQGNTHGWSWNECLGEVKSRLSTPGASLALSVCLSVCELFLSNLQIFHQLKSPGSACRCHGSRLTKLVAFYHRKAWDAGCGKRRAKKSPTLSYLFPLSHTGFKKTTCQPLRSHRIAFQSASFPVILE